MPTPTTPPTATWSPARGVWETDLVGLCGHSELFSESWPISGTTRAGRAYARPMWAHLTDDSASSSSLGLLPTPEAKLSGSGPDYARASRPGSGGDDLTTTVHRALLPTPAACVANDGEGTETWLARRERVKLTAANGNGMGMPLTIAVQLLPTPTSRDHKGPNQRGDDSCLHGALLPTQRLMATPTASVATGGPPQDSKGKRDLRLDLRQLGASSATPSDDGNAA